MNNRLEYAWEILRAEVRAIWNIPINESFSAVIDVILNCGGKVVTTGMGKAGIIAGKMAATLSSTGTPACFLHPGDSQHGDLGVISENDVLLVLSTSGKTREVIEMVWLAKELCPAIPVVSITSHPDSELRELSDIILDVGVIEEPCPLGLVPTASTTAILALCDALALVLMREREFTKEDYGKRHHGGYLGQKARGS